MGNIAVFAAATCDPRTDEVVDRSDVSCMQNLTFSWQIACTASAAAIAGFAGTLYAIEV